MATMKTEKIWANLAVKDLDRTTRFYTALGFKPGGDAEKLTSFFFGNSNFVINFFIEKQLETFMGPIADASKESEVMFSLSAKDRSEVDACAEAVVKAGGSSLFGPDDYEQGYTFSFADPDGHKFNVLYWPGM
jgi:predicted lactoylglutathione lyase